MYVFSTSENGALNLYFKKKKKILAKKQAAKHCKYSCLFYKNQRKESLPFSPTPPFLEKIFYPHVYCQIRGSQSPSLYKGLVSSNYLSCKILKSNICLPYPQTKGG